MKGHSSTLRVQMFTDVVDSVGCKKRMGDIVYARLAARHDELFKSLIAASPGARIRVDTGDGFYAEFATPSDAVNAALRFQYGLHTPDWKPACLDVRVGIHVGTVTEMSQEGTAGGGGKLIGFSTDMTSRIMSLATGGQILMTRPAFDDARQFVREHPPVDGLAPEGAPLPRLEWVAHGSYLMKGNDESIEVFEVGAVGQAPLAAPPDGPKAERVVSEQDRAMLGWRPAAGLDIPRRKGWVADRKLGEGAFGEVWLGKHEQTQAVRVFKFCYELSRRGSFERELALYTLLRKALGDRPDIAQLYEVQLEQSPYFLESEFSAHGDLLDWAAARGGIQTVPLATRLDIVRRVAEAVAAAHSVGILHKDIKPSNILIRETEDGAPRPVLSDFGIGVLADASKVDAETKRRLGPSSSSPPAPTGGYPKTLTDVTSSGPGTPMYSPPELQAGAPFTVQGDWFALGVLLYQMVAGNLKKPMAGGWERDVPDELLREDIARCVDGDPLRRMSGSQLAKQIETLEERRRERAEAERVRLADEERAAALRRQVARRKRLSRVAIAAAAVLTVVLCFVGLGLLHERQLRHQAVAAKRQAQAAEGRALASKDAALAAERQAVAAKEDALLRQAEGTVLQGDALSMADQHVEARRRYDEAYEQFARLKAPAFGCDLAQWNLNLACAWPVASWDNVGGGARGVPLRGVVLSPDGRQFIAVGDDKACYLRDVRTGGVVRAFVGHETLVTAVAFAPAGDRVVTGGMDLTIRLWDAQGHLIRTIPAAHEAGLSAVALSPDGRRIASAGWDRTMKVWDAESGQRLQTFGGGDDDPFVRCVAFSPDGRYLASGTNEPAPRAATAGASTRPTSAPTHSATSPTEVAPPAPAPSANPAVASAAGTLQLYEVDPQAGAGSFVLARTIGGHRIGVAGLAFCPTDRPPGKTSPDGAAGQCRLVTAGSDGTLKLWDAPTGELLRTFVGHRGAVDGVAFSPDGRRILSASWDKTLKLWDLDRDREIRTFAGHTHWAHAVALAPDGKHAVSAAEDGTVKVWTIDPGRELRTLAGHAGPVGAVAFSPDGRRALSGGADHTLRLWDVASGRPLLTFAGHARWVFCAGFSPDGWRAVSGSGDGTLKIWDARTGKELHTLTGHAGSVLCCAFSPDGRWVVSGGRDDTVRLWDASTGTLVRTFMAAGGAGPAHAGAVTCVAWAPDGSRVISGSFDQTLKVWDPQSGAEVRTLGGNKSTGGAAAPAGHAAYVTGVVFCRDAAQGWTRAISAGGDGQLHLWDLRDGTLIRTSAPRDGSTGPIDGLALSPDGRYAVTAGGRLIRFWDVQTGTEVRGLAGHTDAVAAVAFDPDPSRPARVLTAGWDGTAKVWDFGRPAKEHAMAPRVSDAWKQLAAAPAGGAIPGAALATAGEWYAFRGADDWAAEALSQARAAGTAVPAPTLARCYWETGHFAAARDELQRAASEAPTPDEQAHYAMCRDIAAAQAIATTQPAAGESVAEATTRPAAGTFAAADNLCWNEDGGAVGAAPVRFSVVVTINPPGRRDWTEIDARTWEERWPDGTTRYYDVTGRLDGRPEDGGRRGVVVNRPPYTTFQMLIPDCGTTGLMEYRVSDSKPGEPPRWKPWKQWAPLHVIDRRGIPTATAGTTATAR